MNFRNEETPFIIRSEEDWKKIKCGWYVSYICNKCGEKHIKKIDKRNRKNTCFDPSFSLYKYEETPFIIRSEEDWKKVKSNWWVSYICNKCGKQHVKKLSSVNRKNTCLNKIPYFNKETPFEIKFEGDWKKVKAGWRVSYICNNCGEKHVKKAVGTNHKNTCLNKIYFNKETPFEIQTEEDWKKVKVNWYISYICNKCGKRHIKKIDDRTRKNTCFDPSFSVYKNKETPFEINSEDDWKMVKCGWYVSYICNKCSERHIKKVNDSKCAKNTCRKLNNIKYTYRENYIDKYVFAF